jgi:hypothetical protein
MPARSWFAAVAFVSLASMTSHAQGPPVTIDDLVRMTGPQLEALYAVGTVPPIPSGRVKGRAIYYPGTRWAVPISRGARAVWQGKVFDPEAAMAVNKFFGVRSVPGKLYQGQSWRDGQPALILDYQETSRIYRNNRDEIRQVGPGLYLGLMYARTSPQPTLKMYFALEQVP